jgi:tellurite resistance protein TehA-like permease
LASVAPAFGGASFLGAILLWGYGIWWLATAVLITLRYLRDGLPFNIGWWGYTFPLGVFSVATLRLSTMVPMSAIAVFGAVLVTALACMWLLVAAKTIKGALDRSLFIAPCLKAD